MATSTMAPLDHESFPDIMDSIILSGDWETWIALRGASATFKTRVDDLLRRHLVMTHPAPRGANWHPVIITGRRCNTRIAPTAPTWGPVGSYADILDDTVFDRALTHAHVVDLKGALDPPPELIFKICPRVLRIMPDSSGEFYRGVRSFSALAYHLVGGREGGTLVVFAGALKPKGDVNLPAWMRKVVFNLHFWEHEDRPMRLAPLPFNVQSFDHMDPVGKELVYIFPDNKDVPLHLVRSTLMDLIHGWNLDLTYTVVNLEGVCGGEDAASLAEQEIPQQWIKEMFWRDRYRLQLAMANVSFVTRAQYRARLDPGEWELETEI